MRFTEAVIHPTFSTDKYFEMKYGKIAVIYGSDSSEWEVSCRSGVFVASQIEGCDIYEIFARFGRWSVVAYRKKGCGRTEFPESERPEVDKNDFSAAVGGEKVKFDYAYIVQHGTPGENGLMQGYLEMLGIPFSSCSAFVSSITFDKYTCKNYLRDVDYIKLADEMFIRKGEDAAAFADAAADRLGFPMFVKPTDGGSSFGVTKVKKKEDIVPALEVAFSEGKTVIAEKAINGRELTCGVYRGDGGISALPVIEIVPENEFFDYEAKYEGRSKEICPAEIPAETAERIQEVSRKIYSRFGCSGIVRMDYFLAPDGLYFLEMNTVPGMTSASLVPQMVRAAGLDMTEFLASVIENS